MESSTSSARKVGKVNAKTREKEFQALSDSVLICNYCCYEIDWMKKSTIIDHLKSEKHITCKRGVEIKPQSSIEDVLSRQDKKQQIITDFVEMMIEANIPREKKAKWGHG